MPVVIDEHGVDARGGGRGRSRAAERSRDSIGSRRASAIVEMLRASGALQKVETHQHAVRHCYRCDTVVEPRLSRSVVREDGAARASRRSQGVRDGAIRILPERWEAVYVNWLTNIRDWNISRQLWWGHRVPVWYCDELRSAARTSS